MPNTPTILGFANRVLFIALALLLASNLSAQASPPNASDHGDSSDESSIGADPEPTAGVDLTPNSESKESRNSLLRARVRILVPGNGTCWASVAVRNNGAAPFHGELVLVAGEPARWQSPGPIVRWDALLEPGEARTALLPIPALPSGERPWIAFFGPSGFGADNDPEDRAILSAEVEALPRGNAGGSTERRGRRGFRGRVTFPESSSQTSSLSIGRPRTITSSSSGSMGFIELTEVVDATAPSGYPEYGAFYAGIVAELSPDQTRPQAATDAIASGLRAGASFVISIAEDTEQEWHAVSALVRTLTGADVWGQPQFNDDAAVLHRATREAFDGRILTNQFPVGPSGLGILPLARLDVRDPSTNRRMPGQPEFIPEPVKPATATTLGGIPVTWFGHFVSYRVGLGILTITKTGPSSSTNSFASPTINPLVLAETMGRVPLPPQPAEWVRDLDVSKGLVIPPIASVLWVVVYVVLIGPLLAIWIRRKRSAMLVPMTALASVVAVVLIVLFKWILGLSAPDRRELLVTWHDETGQAVLTDHILGHLEGHSTLPVGSRIGAAMTLSANEGPATKGTFIASAGGLSMTSTGHVETQPTQLALRAPAIAGLRMSIVVDGDRVTNTGDVSIVGGFVVTHSIDGSAPKVASIVPALKPGESGVLSYNTENEESLPLSETALTITSLVAGVDASPSMVGPSAHNQTPALRLRNVYSIAVLLTEKPTSQPLTSGESPDADERYGVSVCPVTLKAWPTNPLFPKSSSPPRP